MQRPGVDPEFLGDLRNRLPGLDHNAYSTLAELSVVRLLLGPHEPQFPLQSRAPRYEGRHTDHLGYGKHDPAGKDGGNSRYGTRSKTVLTDIGPVEIDVPRDREGSFEPAIVKKRQRGLTGVDEMVLSLSAKGLTHGEISSHLAEVYGASVSKTTISTITDKVMDGMAEWQNRPLDRTRLPGRLH